MNNEGLVYNGKMGCSQYNIGRNRTERSTRNYLPERRLTKRHDKNNLRSDHYMKATE